MTPNANAKKILVVEDDTSLRKAIIEKLTHHGFQALEAQDGEQGLRVTLNSKPDLIILDLLMPIMDGMTMLKKLRDLVGKVPVIILTNFDPNDQTLRDVVEYQPTYYLMKSDIELESLVSHIKETLKLDNSPTTSVSS